MVGFAIGFCWYHLRHANREALRGFEVEMTTRELHESMRKTNDAR